MERLGPEAELSRCTTPADLDAALDRDHDAIVIAGGDGSLHAVANALHRRGRLGDRTVGLVPMGTGNDFARGLGIPLDPVDAAGALLEGVERRLDLLVDDTGEVTVNALHIGVGADTTRAASRWKKLLGPASFPVGGLIAGWAARGYRLWVEADGETVIDTDHKVLMVGLANGRNVGAGSAVLDPDARSDNGSISLVVSRSRGFTARVVHAMRLYRGTHPMESDVYRRMVRTVTVTGERSPGSVDGEIRDDLTGRTWHIMPGAWTFLLPKDPRLS